MSRRVAFPIAVLVTALMMGIQFATAQTPLQASALPLRSGPGAEFQTIGEVPVGSFFFLTARNADGTWLLVVTPDRAQRGWVPARYVTLSVVNVARLPVSAERVASDEPSATNDTTRIPVGFNLSVIEQIDLTAYPVVGLATATARAIYQRGQAMGRDPHQLAKVGDCFSDHEYYLKYFTWGRYNLGEYATLQPVIDFFGESMDDLSYAASVGFVTGAVLDPIWANPEVCQPGESPLACEYRVHNPSVALIMFGTQDVLLMTPEQFDTALREVVRQTIAANIIPILSTFPSNMDLWDKTLQYNQIVVNIALDFDIPLINLWLALEGLPGHGLDGSNHLSFPLTTAADLTQPNLTTGYPMRNLVTLQTLDNVWRSLMR